MELVWRGRLAGHGHQKRPKFDGVDLFYHLTVFVKPYHRSIEPIDRNTRTGRNSRTQYLRRNIVARAGGELGVSCGNLASAADLKFRTTSSKLCQGTRSRMS